MESNTNTGRQESGDLINERRKHMLARLEARHARDTAGVKTSSCDTADFDRLLAKATRVINSAELNAEPELLQELEAALPVIPPGRQYHRLKHVLNVLRNQMQEQIGLTQHHSKFSFSNKNYGVNSKVQETTTAESQPLASTPITAERLIKKAVTVMSAHNEELVLDGDDGEEVAINNVTDSVVRIPFKASAVHIKCVKHSKLIFAPVKTSVLIRDCENLTVVVAAQQLRIHNSHQMLFYIEVKGAVMIEDCDGIEVAPYNVVGIQRDTQNMNWRNVQDFSWLSLEEQSPNWKIMEENAEQWFSL